VRPACYHASRIPFCHERHEGDLLKTYDVVILGAGHHALVLQAYLGKADLEVLSIDRRGVAGGALTTVENPRQPGFLHNTHSFFHRALTQMPWYRDLELERHGASYIEPALNVALVLRDGRTLEWWTDFERTRASFDAISPRDARTLESWRERFLPIVEEILVPESRRPPLPPADRARRLEGSADGQLLLETSASSPLAFVEREFEHPVVKAGLLFFNGLREVDLRARGFGHHIPALLASRGKAQMCRGGSAELARALVGAVREAGGELQLDTTPRRIRVEGGRAVGVETEAGDLVRARRAVVSSLNPQQTFLDLFGPDDLPSGWREHAAAFRYNLLAPLFALDVDLEAPPLYWAAESRPELRQAFMVILGLEDAGQFLEIVAHHERGTIPPTVMWGACPTLFDPSQAPPGKHTAFMWEKLPYRLGRDASTWDEERDAHARRMLDVWADYAPNLAHDVIDWTARSPLDTERAFPNMREGDLLVGAFSHDQVGYHRPFAGAGHYRGPLPGLYLCGSSSHPGGNITGLAGYNCAQVLLADLGLEAPWFASS
jgi:phytoene dehydrogenase-like protein